MGKRIQVELVARSGFGFGDLEAPYWFIGLEPGLGRKEHNELKDRIDLRISAWEEKEIQDLYEYHYRIGVDWWFRPKAKLQKTWAKLIRMLFVLDGKPVDVDSIREFQSDKWGRTKSKTCLLELFPLPCPSTKAEHWKSCYDIERRFYEERCRKIRLPRFHQLITEYRPAAVIFYGLKKMEDWKLIAGIDSKCFMSEGSMGVKNGTLYYVVKHPAAKGVSNMYFEDAGTDVRRLLNGLIHNRNN
ncbi:hypothetical protein DNFV4_04513 [Nitrospira tepida]|uniref:Uracil-DNA glycosylase-like domain-containing protein n=1 Tax=Nitrospira tepida TaxID=2973512 RepID=A0AA86TFV7_9BACT|nr:hypothetical protein [Nitrospira tepida]CAI4034069.1 hypothetical protein DNFV4_04513 [Nitrospira tepida]